MLTNNTLVIDKIVILIILILKMYDLAGAFDCSDSSNGFDIRGGKTVK
jgi:hypothetical protein